MATIKSYTDIEQSKKLAEILPLESADMYYFLDPTPAGNIYHLVVQRVDIGIKNLPQYNEGDIPCWSLAALLGVLPKEIKDEDYDNEITPLLYPMQGKWYMVYNEIDTDGYCPYLEKTGSTPIYACYEMIIELHEQNLL